MIGGIYKCKTHSLDIRNAGEIITEVVGTHLNNKTKEDVQILIIENQVCHHLPIGLDAHFPNVYHLDVRNSSLTNVTSEQMKMFPKLKHLYIRGNPIEILPERLFVHNPLLEFIKLDDNRIMRIDANIFDPLPKLEMLSLEKNVCIADFAIGKENLKTLIDLLGRNCS